MHVNIIANISEIDSRQWNKLSGVAYPFFRHEFLLALEQSGVVSKLTGWQPQHLLVSENNIIQAVMPLYVKSHSWGEYVFDHAWAQAYQQHGLHYYPKLLTSIPFTPCQGQRLAIMPGADQTKITRLAVTAIQQFAARQQLSSWHCLFPDQAYLEQLRHADLIIREDVQFQWLNRGYQNFEDFLQTLNSAKRKMIKRERRKIAEQGISLQRLSGPEITAEHWQSFYRFYAMTYLKRHSQPYLNLEFFLQLASSMPEQLQLVLAIKDNSAIAAALCFVGSDTLYGRYWGCDTEYDALHFEVCYYQGIEYCINHGLNRFDSGAQGEHKIARGFEPITTYSAHWLKDNEFAGAIANFVERERKHVQGYKLDAEGYLPFRRE